MERGAQAQGVELAPGMEELTEIFLHTLIPAAPFLSGTMVLDLLQLGEIPQATVPAVVTALVELRLGEIVGPMDMAQVQLGEIR